MSSASRSWIYQLRTAAGRQLRALIPPITPRLILRALLGVFLFLCGIVAGVWILIRSRRNDQES